MEICELQNNINIENKATDTNISKSICKIKIETQFNNIIGTGFLLKFWINQECFYCLVSNEHVIKTDLINNNSNIYIL